MDPTLKQMLAEELNEDLTNLTSDVILEELENWDSVMVLGLMVLIGDYLGKEITPEDMENLVTFGDIEKLIKDRSA